MAKEYTCAECGKKFTSEARYAKYCSDDCRKKAARRKYAESLPVFQKICPICKKEFAASNKRRKYCSPACYAESVKIRARGEKRPENVKTCPVCKKEFTTKSRHPQTFCSLACRREYWRQGRRDYRQEYAQRMRSENKLKTSPRPKKPAQSIEAINDQARAAGMSYGQYVASMGQEINHITMRLNYEAWKERQRSR